MSVTKYTAGVSTPDGASEGVSPSANQNTMICIGFAEIEVYGKEGANWVLLGTTTADDKVVFVPFTTYFRSLLQVQFRTRRANAWSFYGRLFSQIRCSGTISNR
jgi:glycopeptide antibiotics resistance protein